MHSFTQQGVVGHRQESVILSPLVAAQEGKRSAPLIDILFLSLTCRQDRHPLPGVRGTLFHLQFPHLWSQCVNQLVLLLPTQGATHKSHLQFHLERWKCQRLSESCKKLLYAFLYWKRNKNSFENFIQSDFLSLSYMQFYTHTHACAHTHFHVGFFFLLHSHISSLLE